MEPVSGLGDYLHTHTHTHTKQHEKVQINQIKMVLAWHKSTYILNTSHNAILYYNNTTILQCNTKQTQKQRNLALRLIFSIPALVHTLQTEISKIKHSVPTSCISMLCLRTRRAFMTRTMAACRNILRSSSTAL